MFFHEHRPTAVSSDPGNSKRLEAPPPPQLLRQHAQQTRGLDSLVISYPYIFAGITTCNKLANIIFDSTLVLTIIKYNTTWHLSTFHYLWHNYIVK